MESAPAAIEKATVKAAENIGSKVGEAVGERVYNAVAPRKTVQRVTSGPTATIPTAPILPPPSVVDEKFEARGKEIMRALQKKSSKLGPATISDRFDELLF